STATPPSELYTLSLHDALPIWRGEHDDQQNDGKDPVHARNITVHDGKHTGTRLAATRSFSRSPIERSSHMGTSRNEGEGNKTARSEEHTSELQSRENLVCRLLL